jgi:hypothetical protein
VNREASTNRLALCCIGREGSRLVERRRCVPAGQGLSDFGSFTVVNSLGTVLTPHERR